MRPQTGPKNRLPRGGNNCDFCGSPFVASLYACHNFDWAGRDIFKTKVGRWAACAACSELVTRRDWSMLAARVMKEVKNRKGITPAELSNLRGDLRLLYAAIDSCIIKGEALGVLQPHYARRTG